MVSSCQSNLWNSRIIIEITSKNSKAFTKWIEKHSKRYGMLSQNFIFEHSLHRIRWILVLWSMGAGFGALRFRSSWKYSENHHLLWARSENRKLHTWFVLQFWSFPNDFDHFLPISDSAADGGFVNTLIKILVSKSVGNDQNWSANQVGSSRISNWLHSGWRFCDHFHQDPSLEIGRKWSKLKRKPGERFANFQ